MEIVSSSELNFPPEKRKYLVYHAVYHKSKRKIRIVFDCSLKNGGVSLNDELLQGPDFINRFVVVLLSFRKNEIVIMANMESMFFADKDPASHSDYMRLFWYEDGNLNSTLMQYRLKWHTFGAVSSPSVANFSLKRTVLDYDRTVRKESSDTILLSSYVDDVMTSLTSEKDATVVLREIRDIAASAGFILRDVASNSRRVLSSVPKDALSKELKEFDLSKDNLLGDQVLGMLGCPG